MYHNFTNLFSKLSESPFYREISKFSKKYRVVSIRYYYARDSLTRLRTPDSTIFGFMPKIDNASVLMLKCILG